MKNLVKIFTSIMALALVVFFSSSFKNSSKENNILKFDFGNGKVQKGCIQVQGSDTYSKERGYGFIGESEIKSIKRKGKDAFKDDFCISEKPFYFATDLPEGFYEVKITFGDKKGSSKTTVKAESRRLMLEEVSTSEGEFITKSIMVNVRTPKIDSVTSIRLKKREINYVNWDDKLTIEFNNSDPKICGIEIIERKDLTTVFLAGNSTVVDQEYEPWCSWGQMITRFFNEDVVVANYAESGEALKSFQAARRFQKILSVMKPGDYLFIEFGHNDQKPKSSSYVEPFTGYKEELKKLINGAREKGGIPILVSSMHRRSFTDEGEIINTHGDYPLAVKQTAEETGVAFINLNDMSEHLYEALGIEGSKRAFVHYPANSFPRQGKPLADNSHFSPYGAYQIAKCILSGIKKADIGLSQNILPDFTSYDPSKPDLFENWVLPSSPSFQMIKPDGY